MEEAPDLRSRDVATHVAASASIPRGFARSLNYSRRAAFLVDGDHRILWRNAAAERLLEEGASLVAHAGILALPAQNDLFARRITEALRCDLGTANENLCIDDLAQQLVLEILPAFEETPAALVIVREFCSDQEINAELQRRYALTQQEARLALDLASGLSVDDIIAQRKLRRVNLRTQMREVCEKLGVTRPAAMMALIWRMRSGF